MFWFQETRTRYRPEDARKNAGMAGQRPTPLCTSLLPLRHGDSDLHIMKARMHRTLICLLLLQSALLAQTVEGTVSSTGGTALAGVSVVLMKAGGQNEVTEYRAVTDAAGAFRLQDVKDGVYVVDLQADGYWGPNPGGPGNRPFAVVGGQPTTRLRLEMMPEGKVSGRVLDGTDSPVPGASLVLAVPNGMLEQGTSGADGSFAFEQLVPGAYSLLAAAPSGWKPPDPADGQAFAWVPTYYGEVSFREGAAPIVVRPGGDVSAQDVKLLTAPVHRLRGQVLEPAGDAAPGVKVELSDTANREARSTVSSKDGSFEFAITDRKWRLSAEAGSNEAKLAADISVEVAGKDLDDVTLRLTTPFSIHGSVRFDPPEGGKLPVGVLFTRGGDGAGPPVFGQFDENGKFTVDGIYQGVYGIRIAPPVPASGYFLDGIRVGDRETLTRDVELISGSVPISILFKAGGGAVQGTVADCGDANVILLPKDRSMRRQSLVRMARCAEGGRFEIPSVRPGDYYIFALASGNSALVPPYEMDRDYLNQAVRLTVTNNSTASVELKVIPPRWF